MKLVAAPSYRLDPPYKVSATRMGCPPARCHSPRRSYRYWWLLGHGHAQRVQKTKSEAGWKVGVADVASYACIPIYSFDLLWVICASNT